jgi:uncharacterized protein YdhG (YjbR/CyaY superfamily)
MSPARRKPKTVEEYLAAVPAPQRAALEKLRRTIRAAAPKATEGLAWGMPSFRLRVWLVCYAAFKDHCSFFPMSVAVMEQHARPLKPFSTTKGTIRFTPDKPLPAALVRSIVRARIAETANS